MVDQIVDILAVIFAVAQIVCVSLFPWVLVKVLLIEKERNKGK
jgi:hypothetical protein